MMKLLLMIVLALAGIVPVSTHAQTFNALPNSRARTLDLRALSIQSTDTSGCYRLGAAGYGYWSNGDWQEAYDTLRLYMEHCYSDDSWRVFGQIDAAVSQWGDGGIGRWPDFLSWLKKVLYLNSDSNWYCNDVSDMITAVQSDQVSKLAIAKYLIEKHKCSGFGFQTVYNAASHWRHQMWLDSITRHYDSLYGYHNWSDSIARDTVANPYDSTIPSLYALGLQILLGPQYAVNSPSTPFSAQALLSAQLLNNPVSDEIGIKFQMGREALVTMELHDVLGRNIPIQYGKYQLTQAGSHTAHIPDPNLPAGTYYLRISTDAGDVLTLKLIKQ